MPEILQDELPNVQVELGNWWSVTPGSQILWTTAVNNVLKRARYKDVNDDLKNLMLDRYGELPFYKPADWIYESVFGPNWKTICRARRRLPEDRGHGHHDREKGPGTQARDGRPRRTNWCFTCSTPMTPWLLQVRGKVREDLGIAAEGSGSTGAGSTSATRSNSPTPTASFTPSRSDPSARPRAEMP